MKRYYHAAYILLGMLMLGPQAEASEKGSKQIATELETVVVTATRTEHTLANVPEATTVITGEELKIQNATNALEALRWIPGLNISLGYGAHGEDSYKVDGAESSYTLVLVDGNRGKGRYVLSEIPVSMIERIEVIKGANSLLYGSDAMSGVINMITKKTPEKFTGSIKGSYAAAEEESNTQEATLGFTLGKLRQIYSYKRAASEDGDYQGDSFIGKFGIDLGEKVKLGFGVKVNQFEMDYISSDKYDLHMNMDWQIDEKASLKAKVFFQDYGDEINSMGSTYTLDTLYNEEELVYTRLFGGSHLLTVGYQRMDDDVDYKAPTRRRMDNRYSNNVFLQDEISVTEKLIVVPAIRMDFHNIWDDQINPKLSVLWQATDSLSLRTSWGTAFKAPTHSQLYIKFRHPGNPPFWVQGNPDLEPEESRTLRISAEKRFGNTFLANVAIFRNDFENQIIRVPVENSRDQSYGNVEEAMTQGVEMELKYYITDNLIGILGYTYLDTENKDTGETLPYTVGHRITPRILYNNQGMGFTIQLGGDYEKYTKLRGIARYDKDQNKEIFIVNANISKQITDSINIWVNGENLFNEKSVDGLAGDGTRVIFGLRFNW